MTEEKLVPISVITAQLRQQVGRFWLESQLEKKGTREAGFQGLHKTSCVGEYVCFVWGSRKRGVSAT